LNSITDVLAQAELEGDLSAKERNELDELERRKRRLRNEGKKLSDPEEKRRSSLGQRRREGAVRLGGPFNLRVDWWEEEGDQVPKTFAGKQEVLRMALAMRSAIQNAVQDVCPLEYRSLLQAEDGSKVEPFYFDARRFAHPLDTGFSLDKQEKTLRASAAPMTELLGLIGLQRFRPRPTDQDKGTFEYFTWNQPLGVVAAAVACGAVPVVGRRGFRFRLQFRDDQKRYKAFGFAVPIGGENE
jgi:CRISPR-associated protein Csb3